MRHGGGGLSKFQKETARRAKAQAKRQRKLERRRTKQDEDREVEPAKRNWDA